MIPLRKNFKLADPLKRAVNDDAEREELSRILEELVLSPGEESSKSARKYLKRLHENYEEV
ncbi:hypothetical protein [Halomonas sp. CKK8]|uniref:hypothetical protein n=1 Tax=Halomonas sp. CKK8 TaxID=3036127 RepID=UPI0024157673|nr:hypothetical protein [Halomonas sp. CKK8]WFM70990.1 hypothetical protein P8934_16580 [Halomonas sp. CKK8]